MCVVGPRIGRPRRERAPALGRVNDRGSDERAASHFRQNHRGLVVWRVVAKRFDPLISLPQPTRMSEFPTPLTGRGDRVTSTFREFEAYASVVSDADLRMSLPRLECPRWTIDALSVGTIRLQFGSEGSGNITEGVARPGGRVLFLPTAGFHRANGQPMTDGSVLLMQPCGEFTISVQEAHDWASVYVPFDVLNPETAERDDGPTVRRYTGVVEAGSNQVSQLRRLLAWAREAIQVEPTVLTSPAALRSLQSELLAACRPAVSLHPPPPVPTPGRSLLPRGEIVRIVRELVDRHPDECPSVDALATAADVSERTLRNVFLDYFGVPPRYYLAVRRLHQVRAVLRSSDPDAITVTAVAARFGFWHFGRFAREYRRLFGERPSETLYRRTVHRIAVRL